MNVRRRLARRLALVTVTAWALPFSWEPGAALDHLRSSALIASVLLAAVLAVRRDPTPDERYAAAMPRAVAMRVELGHARVASLHERDRRTHVVLTWREARTVLLDAGYEPIAEVGRNKLAAGWTMSIAYDDDEVPRLLARDRDGGRLTLLAAVSTENDPWARIGNSPMHLQRCDVEFPSWTGEAPLRRVPTDR